MEESSISPLMQNPAQDASCDSAVSNPQYLSLPSPQIVSSPSIDISSMTSPPQQLPAQQPMVSQSGVMAVQRSGYLARANPLHNQHGATVAAGGNAMRQQVSLYGAAPAAQMNFGGSPIQQQLMAGMSRTGMIGHSGQLPLLPGQSPTQFSTQSQMPVQSRQKMGFIPSTQFLPANSSGQTLQSMGIIGSLGLNTQIRANGTLSYGQQRLTAAQIKQQQQLMLSQQLGLTSPQKLTGQNLARASSLAAINSQLSSLVQNGQSALAQNAISQQQLPKSMQSVTSGSVSSSYQLQQQRFYRQNGFMPQQLSSSFHPKATSLSQQHLSQLVQQQQQQQFGHQQKLHHLQQIQQLQQQQHHQQQLQQQSPRMGSPLQRSISLSGSQPDPSQATTPRGSSSQGTDTTNQLLGKRKIQDLVSQIDSLAQLDPEVEDMLLEIADDFIDSVTTFACSLAKHRKSSTLEAKDMLLHLEKNLHLTIPGYSKDDSPSQRSLPSEVHMKRLELVRSLMEAQQSERDAISVKKSIKLSNSPIGGLIQPLSSEQLALATAGTHMLNKVQRY